MKVHETAFVTCAYKATNEELSHDYYAKLWVTEQTTKWVQESIEYVSEHEPFVHCLRNRYILDAILAFLKDKNDACLLNFGAGFSMYPYALPKDITYIEIDQADVVEYKQKFIQEWVKAGTLPDRAVKYIASDFRTDSRENLVNQLTKLINKRPTFIILEGVLYFLTPSVTEKLFSIFAAIQSEGDQIASVSFLPESIETEPFNRLRDYFEKNNTTNDTFSCQTHSEIFYKSRAGYKQIDHTDYVMLSNKYSPENAINDKFSILNENIHLLERNDIRAENIEIVEAENKDLKGILELQSLNLIGVKTSEEIQNQGFLTVKHDFETLEKMQGKYRHIIAKVNHKVVGYALVMLAEYAKNVPDLVVMFEQFQKLKIDGKTLTETKYMAMGQVCVGEEVRGMDVFARLYEGLRKAMSADFDYIVTEISSKNYRSIKAHENVGFITLGQYDDPFLGVTWNVVLLRTK